MSAEERDRALEQRLAAVGRPAARPAFRADLRQRFVMGAASAPADDDVLPEDRRTPSKAASSARWKFWGVLAAAAAVIAALILFKPAPLHWRVLPGSTATTARVDGKSLPVAEGEAFARALNDAQSVVAEGGSLRLAHGDEYALDIAPEARINFAVAPSTGGVDVFTMGLEGSAVHVVTGPAFPGRLTIKSGDAIVMVTGTAFGIDNLPEGTCVCNLHGTLSVQRKDGQPKPLAAGRQCWFANDVPELKWAEVHPEHILGVRALEEAANASWKH